MYVPELAEGPEGMGEEIDEFHANEEFEEIVRPKGRSAVAKKSWASTQNKNSKK